MPATHHIDSKAQLIVTTWEGHLGDIELIEVIKKYQNSIQNNPDYSNYNEVVNFSNITDFKLTIEGIKSVGRIAATTDLNNANRKLALIVSSNLVFGFARMYEAYRSFAKNSHKEIHVFKTEKKAYEWLQK